MQDVNRRMIYEARDDYLKLGGEHEETHYLKSVLATSDGKLFPFRQGVKLCKQSYLNCLGISATKLRTAQELLEKGDKFVGQVTERDQPLFEHDVLWLSLYIQND